MKRKICVISAVLITILSIDTFGYTIINCANGWSTCAVEKYIERIPAEMIEDYSGAIYIVPQIESDEHPMATGLYYFDDSAIYVDEDDPAVVIHELGHHVYFTTELTDEIMRRLSAAAECYETPPHSPFGPSQYMPEVFAYMFTDYYLDRLNDAQRDRFEEVLEEICKRRGI